MLLTSQSAEAAVAAMPTLEASRSGLITSTDQAVSALPYIITPERRALLNTIRFAEGTWKNGHDVGYRVMFGGSLMGSMDRHPDRVIYSSRYASAAAGAYQFMPFTWDMVKRSLGVRGFGPEVQDQGALFLVQRRKALLLTDVGVMTPQLAAKLAPEWASFPTLRGRSYYGQPVKRFVNLKSFYKVNLSQLRQIRDQRQEALSTVDGNKGQKAPVCSGPKILCGMP
jgi:lysozyme